MRNFRTVPSVSGTKPGYTITICLPFGSDVLPQHITELKCFEPFSRATIRPTTANVLVRTAARTVAAFKSPLNSTTTTTNSLQAYHLPLRCSVPTTMTHTGENLRVDSSSTTTTSCSLIADADRTSYKSHKRSC